MEYPDSTARARALFLRDDNRFGCAEASYLALAEAFDLAVGEDSGPAMALNGGVAYGGGICGAISGPALAVGMLSERRLDDHARAKRVARLIVADLMDEFERHFGSRECRALIGLDLRAPGEHERFVASGAWRTGCMAQIEFAVAALAGLADPDAWERRVREIEGA